MDKLELIGTGTSYESELFDMVADTTMFSGFSGEDIRHLVKYIHAYRAEMDIDIFVEGEPGHCMGLLVAGAIDVLKKDSDGAMKKISSITPGKSFGEMSVLDGLAYSATLRTSKPSTLLLLTRANLHKLVETHAATGVKLIWELARLISLRLRQTSGQLVDALGE